MRRYLAMAAVAAGLIAASPVATNCQEDSSDIECMCIFFTEADWFDRSDLVVIGRISGRSAPEPGYGVGGPDSVVVVAERFEKGRAITHRFKVLATTFYGSSSCDCGPHLPDDLDKHRFYLARSHSQPGYYVLTGLSGPEPRPSPPTPPATGSSR